MKFPIRTSKKQMTRHLNRAIRFAKKGEKHNMVWELRRAFWNAPKKYQARILKVQIDLANI